MKKRLFAAVLAMVMSVGLLSACGQKPANSGSESTPASSQQSQPADTSSEASKEAATEADKPAETVTIKIRHYGVVDMVDEAKVIEALNKYTEEKIGVVIEYESIANSEYHSKTKLDLAADPDFDLFWSNNKHTALARDGALLDLTDIIPKYKDLYEAHSQADWDSVAVDGKNYFILNKKEAALAYSIATPKALADKVKAEKGIDFNTIEVEGGWLGMSAMEPYIEAALEIGGSDIDVPIYSLVSMKQWVGLDGKYEKTDTWPLVYDPSTKKIVNYLETEDAKAITEMMDEWNEKGFWDERLLMDGVLTSAILETPNFVIAGWTKVPDNEAAYATRYPGYEAYINDATDAYIHSTSNVASGWCIPASVTDEKTIDAVLRWVELIQTDSQAANLFTFGAEGVHWNYTADGYVEKTEAASGWNNATWKTGNYWVTGVLTTEDKDKVEKYTKYNEEAKVYEIVGLRLRWDNHAAEKTAVTNAWKEHEKQILYGFDGMEALEACNKAMHAGGLQAMIDEAQKQLDAYLAQ